MLADPVYPFMDADCKNASEQIHELLGCIVQGILFVIFYMTYSIGFVE